MLFSQGIKISPKAPVLKFPNNVVTGTPMILFRFNTSLKITIIRKMYLFCVMHVLYARDCNMGFPI